VSDRPEKPVSPMLTSAPPPSSELPRRQATPINGQPKPANVSPASTSSSASFIPLATEKSRGWHRIPEWLRDIIWPTVLAATDTEAAVEQGRRDERRDADLAAIDGLAAEANQDVLTAASDAVKASFDAEKDRRASVESRLTTVLGMVSIAASIAFGALTSVFGAGFQGVNTPTAVLGAVLMVYAVVQLVNALLAALRGLRRAGYENISPADVLPRSGESRVDHQLRTMRVTVNTRVQHADVNSKKVESMDVAHTALRNFVIAVLLLSGLVASVMVRPGNDRSVAHRVISQLRSDTALIEVLRGPRGLPGPRGQPGIRGPVGPGGPR
jgi:hypothetical protein